MKTIILFAVIILVGLIGVLAANSFDGQGESEAAAVRANVGCALGDC